jgi:hypothetical protein
MLQLSKEREVGRKRKREEIGDAPALGHAWLYLILHSAVVFLQRKESQLSTN